MMTDPKLISLGAQRVQMHKPEEQGLLYHLAPTRRDPLYL